MTAKQLADKLDGREYLNEITPEEAREAQINGLVVVYGYSDDNVEFAGAIADEVGAYQGATIHLTKDGVLQCLDCEDMAHECPFYKVAIRESRTINAVWDKEGYDFAWMFETNIPHETFRVLEDGEHFCLGIVFDINDLK